MRSVHSTNANRRFKVSQDFVPRKELFSVLDIMAVEPITMRLCFRSEDLKKKKEIIRPRRLSGLDRGLLLPTLTAMLVTAAWLEGGRVNSTVVGSF